MKTYQYTCIKLVSSLKEQNTIFNGSRSLRHNYISDDSPRFFFFNAPRKQRLEEFVWALEEKHCVKLECEA